MDDYDIGIGGSRNALDFYSRFWRPSELVLSNIEARGILLDADVCRRKAAELEDTLFGLELELEEWAGCEVNWASPKQVGDLLYGVRNFPTPPVKGTLRAVQLAAVGERPTGEASITWLADNLPREEDREAMRLLLELKKASKDRQFAELLPRYQGSDGRIHCGLSPNTETGRLSARNPNLQQMPSSVREAFIASPGNKLICLDYSGLEWRILAHILVHRYGDTSLVDDIKANIDPHSATAQRMYPECADCPVEEIKAKFPEQRAAAKIINYSVNYGKTAVGLGVQLRNPDGSAIGTERAQALLDAFFRANPGIARFHEDIKRYARERGYVRTLLGRYRYIPEVRSDKRWLRSKGERLALNTPIQGSAADIVTAAMLACERGCNPEVELILQVHDELLFEVPEADAANHKVYLEQAMRTCLEPWRKFHCPLDVEGGIGDNWKEAGGK